MRSFEGPNSAKVVPVAVDDFLVFTKASLQRGILQWIQQLSLAYSSHSYVRDDHDVILRQMYVRLDSMSSRADRAPERLHGVFWMFCLVTPMSYGLGEQISTFVSSCTGPRRWLHISQEFR